MLCAFSQYKPEHEEYYQTPYRLIEERGIMEWVSTQHFRAVSKRNVMGYIDFDRKGKPSVIEILNGRTESLLVK